MSQLTPTKHDTLLCTHGDCTEPQGEEGEYCSEHCLMAVVGSGRYYCEHEDCEVVQTGEESEDILFYGIDDRMYCQKHLPTNMNKTRCNNCMSSFFREGQLEIIDDMLACPKCRTDEYLMDLVN